MDNLEFKKIAEFCKKNWKERCEKVIQVADDVCNNDFLFDMPWDMAMGYGKNRRNCPFREENKLVL